MDDGTSGRRWTLSHTDIQQAILPLSCFQPTHPAPLMKRWHASIPIFFRGHGGYSHGYGPE